MGFMQSRLESRAQEATDTIPASQSSSSLQSRPDNDEEGKRSIITLCKELFRILKTAIHEKTGWALKDMNTIADLCDVLTDLGHWQSSVTTCARGKSSYQDDNDLDSPTVSEFFRTLEHDEKFLAGTIRLYFDLPMTAMHDLLAFYESDETDTESSIVSLSLSSLDIAVQCLHTRLIPDCDGSTPLTMLRPESGTIVHSETPAKADDLMSLIRGAFVKSGRDRFLPCEVLKNIVTKEGVVEILRSEQPGLRHSQQRYDSNNLADQILARCLKIFTILVLLEKGQHIKEFISEPVCDEDLPLGKVVRTNTSEQALPLRCFEPFQQYEREDFIESQWKVLAPFFELSTDARIPYQRFKESTVLPFMEYEISRLLFSIVRKVIIHPEHFKLTGPDNEELPSMFPSPTLSSSNVQPPQNVIFALKRIPIVRGRAAELDKRYLQELNALRKVKATHSHIVKLLATYEHGDTYNFMFPWADEDLYEHWHYIGPPMWDQATGQLRREDVRWMSRQILGLTEAIATIHSLHIRHGDIKLKNILCFSETAQHRVTLKITDFGSADMRTDEEPIAIAANVGIMAKYRPPEADIQDGRLSPASDVWSFGCVLLEYVCWALGGVGLLNELTEPRMSTYITGLHFAQFFDVESSSEGRHFIFVKRSVSEAQPAETPPSTSDSSPLTKEPIEIPNDKVQPGSGESPGPSQKSLPTIHIANLTDQQRTMDQPQPGRLHAAGGRSITIRSGRSTVESLEPMLAQRAETLGVG
ncbi:hypothetical protein EK21DRAFT_114520 [Setomelanomma holmii]|uniref:Protein kinase domain-containing protein n=1 Tax=Setomelanomma holmii TaxID=210430 RepID=A0A9P4H4Z0_9PLEO|nr:hypothetical protein EK21DRAFT_114520 [Setomelanomma holmii]